MQHADPDAVRERALTLQCVACGRDDDLARGWRLYAEPDGLVSYCPECAERELGADER